MYQYEQRTQLLCSQVCNITTFEHMAEKYNDHYSNNDRGQQEVNVGESIFARNSNRRKYIATPSQQLNVIAESHESPANV
jgi:hypothetical protein